MKAEGVSRERGDGREKCRQRGVLGPGRAMLHPNHGRGLDISSLVLQDLRPRCPLAPPLNASFIFTNSWMKTSDTQNKAGLEHEKNRSLLAG